MEVIGRLGNSDQKHPDIRIEEIFTEICADYAFKKIDPYWLGIETAKAFRTASLRKLKVYPQSLRLLDKYRNIPKCIVSNAQRVFTERNFAFLAYTIASISQLCLLIIISRNPTHTLQDGS